MTPPTNFVEHRRCSRYRLRLPVLFSWSDGAHHHQNAGFTRDISVEGAFIFTQVCPPRGSTVKVELVLPVAEDLGREVRLRFVGTVIRVDVSFAGTQGLAVTGDFGREHHTELGTLDR